MNAILDSDEASARALFQSYAGMEGLADVSLPEPALSAAPLWRTTLARIYPGLIAAGTVGLAATWLSQHYAAPVMLFALLIGMAFHFLHEEGRCVEGIELASRSLLRVGVALLGARITASQIAGLGAVPIAMVMFGVASTILFGVVAARWLGLSRIFGVLSGGAVAICGASAALAIATVLPRREESERDTILVVVAVTALSTLAMIFYPALVSVLRFDHVHAGLFLGGTIHDVAQVVGAGYMISAKTGDIATYVKMLRVAMLLPAVFAIAFVLTRHAPAQARTTRQMVPLFLVGFAALVAINSLGWMNAAVASAANDASRWLLVTAISALGMKTSFGKLAAVGWRPIALMLGETVWIAAAVFVFVKWLA
jgi:uncharacterized integral membrane protein (TIGR00698 family)